MHVKLLGTGSAEGWPGLFCGCEICRRSRIVRGKNLRTRSSALIDGALKIDFSPDTLHHIHTHNLDLTQVTHLLFTHAHDDHCAGYELQYLSWMFVPEPIGKPLHVLAPETTIAKIQRELDGAEVPLAFHCIGPWEAVPFGRWQITSVLAKHDDDQVCLNYLISDGAHTILYATDTGWYEDATWDFLAERTIDAAIVECSKGLREDGYAGHMNAEEVIRMREWMAAKGVMAEKSPFVTTHHSHLGGLMHEELEGLLNPRGIEVGFDGMEIEI